jgi:hypothetical protein
MADRPLIARPSAGTSIALPSLAPPPQVGLGAAAARSAAPTFDLGLAMGGPSTLGGAAAGLGSVALPMAPAGTPSMGDVQRRAEMRGGLGAAAAAAAEPRPAPPPTALQSALGEREGELDALYGALANETFTTTTTPNWERPLVENEAQIWEGGGPLEIQPFTPPPIEPGEDEWSYMQRVQALQDADVERQFQEAATLGDVRNIGASGHLGMREAKLQGAEGVGAAELDQQERVAQTLKETAEMSRAATAEARARDIENREFARVQRDAIAEAQATQADLRERVQALPELDANRTFKSMSGGAKFLAMLGSLAGGAIGSSEVNDRLFAIAEQDLETQKANAAQTFDVANAADAAVGQQMGLYRELLGAAGDEAAADAMFLQAQLDDAATMLEAQLAETTVPLLRAQIQESLVGLRAQIDQQQQVIDVKLATTPHSFTTTKGSLGPRKRKKLEERALRLEKERTDFQMKGVESEGKYAEKAYDRETKMMEKGAERETKLAEKAADKDFEIKKASDEWGAVETLVDDFLKANPDEIAGVGAPMGGEQADRIRTRAFKNALELMATSGFTGATASDRQAEQIKSLVDGEMWEMTDDAFRTRMGEILNIASSRRRFYQDQLGSKDPRIGDPRQGLSTFKPE